MKLGLYVEAYRYYLTTGRHVLCIVKWSECVKTLLLCLFYFPSFPKWYCIVRWHIYFFTRIISNVVLYILYLKIEIRLNERMPTLWCVHCSGRAVCKRARAQSIEYVSAASGLEYWFLAPWGKTKKLFTWPWIKHVVPVVFAWSCSVSLF